MPTEVPLPCAQFTALLRHGLVGDLTCLYDPAQRALHTLVALGPDVCGHGGLVHGGMSATVRLRHWRRHACSTIFSASGGMCGSLVLLLGFLQQGVPQLTPGVSAFVLAPCVGVPTASLLYAGV